MCMDYLRCCFAFCLNPADDDKDVALPCMVFWYCIHSRSFGALSVGIDLVCLAPYPFLADPLCVLCRDIDKIKVLACYLQRF